MSSAARAQTAGVSAAESQAVYSTAAQLPLLESAPAVNSSAHNMHHPCMEDLAGLD